MSFRNQLVSLACVVLLAAPGAQAQPNPNGLAYEPDAMIAAADGTILILHEDGESVYRWSPAAGAYTQAMELEDEPEWFTYAPDTDRVYVGYDDGDITVIDLDDGEEEDFIELPKRIRGMAMVDSFLFVVDTSGRGETHYIFDQSGQFLSLLDRNDDSNEYVWNPHNRKMYYFDRRSSPIAFQWEDIDVVGVFGARMESSGNYRNQSIPPLRLSKDGTRLLLGSGVIFDSLSLRPVGALPEAIADAYWRADGYIAAVIDAGDQQLLQIYDRDNRLLSSIGISTPYVRLLPVDDDVYIVWTLDGVPQFLLWGFEDGDLDSDGVIDTEDAFPLDPTEWDDTDGDGTGNNRDPDDDNDGVPDAEDAFPLDPTESVDSDMDGIGNNADPDDDNDGVMDDADRFPFDPTESADFDRDGIGNNADPDDDNDGVNDSDDAFPRNKNESLDTDSDGVGNNADDDDDNDGVLDGNDAFPLDPAESQDSDNDGIGDNADTDGDNDGVDDDVDAFPNNPDEWVDTDSDGIGNGADNDDDNDGMPDTFEIQFGLNPLDSSDATQDPDGDGFTNLEEFNAGTSPTNRPPSQNLLDDSGGGGSMSRETALLLMLVLMASGLRRRSHLP